MLNTFDVALILKESQVIRIKILSKSKIYKDRIFFIILGYYVSKFISHYEGHITVTL